jgi:DNA-directed RNA polymerase subunit M
MVIHAFILVVLPHVAMTRELISFAHTINNPMFCPECKSLLISSAGQLKCRKCGYIRKIENADQMTKKVKRSEKEIMIVEEEGQVKTLPTIQIKCPKCENNLAFWWLRQLRAADESEVRFFRCTECGHTWRQYD